MNENQNRDETVSSDLSEKQTPDEIIRVWNNTRGLKRLTPKERQLVHEHGDVEMTTEELNSGLPKLAQWYKSASNHIRCLIALYLKDPRSWATLRTEPKYPPRLEQFKKNYHSTGAVSIAADWDDALPFCEGLTDAEWDLADAQVLMVQGAYMKTPKNYFMKREFERPPRPEPKTQAQIAMERA